MVKEQKGYWKVNEIKQLIEIAKQEKEKSTITLDYIEYLEKILKLVQMSYDEGVLASEQNHLLKTTHQLGCELESYAHILYYRGLVKAHDRLLELASALKGDSDVIEQKKV